MTASPKIFISYRRDDAPGSTGRLYVRLAEIFDRETLFIDVDAMVPGVDFIRELDDAVIESDVLLAIIGRGWLTAKSTDGRRRIDLPEDFVRIEIATALRNDIRVIPVLVDGAQMPASDELPDDLKALARRHAVELSHMRFAADAERLARTLQFASETQVSTEAADPVVEPIPIEPGTGAAAETPAAAEAHPALPSWRYIGAALTVFAIIASGAIANLWAPPGNTYWLERAGMAAMIWAGTNVMAGPAVSLMVWLPRFTMAQFWGVLGATFAALATMLIVRQVLLTILIKDLSGGVSGTAETIISAGLREIPECVASGIALGYFLSQALGGWFPNRGGPGFILRMIVIWICTGTLYGMANFILITVMEATAAAGSGAEAGLIARATARMWSDTLIFGGAWGLGVLLTFRFAARPTLQL